MGKQDNAGSERMSKEADSALESLQKKSGADFDRAYIQLQCDEHRKVLNELEHELLPNAKDPGLEAYLRKLEPRVADHLAQAERLQKELGGSSGSQSSMTKGSTESSHASNR